VSNGVMAVQAIFRTAGSDRWVGSVSRVRLNLSAVRPPRTKGHLAAEECTDVKRCLGDRPRPWVVRVGELPDPLDGISGKEGGTGPI